MKLLLLALLARGPDPNAILSDGSVLFARNGCLTIISESGEALTNYHVVKNLPDEFTVRDSKGTEYKAVIKSVEPIGDLALVQVISKRTWKPLKLAGDEGVAAGEQVMAIGSSPHLNELTLNGGIPAYVTRGMIALRMPVLNYYDAIIADTRLISGNSGGPLINSRGELAGINGRAMKEAGIGVAIAAPAIERFLPSMRANRIVYRRDLPDVVLTEDYTSGTAKLIVRDGGLPASIAAGTQAAGSELRSGDIIIAVDGNKVLTVRQFESAVRSMPYPQEIELTISRGGKTSALKLKSQRLMPKRAGLKLFTGVTFSDENGKAAVVSVDDDSPAAAAGMLKGDIVTRIDGDDVSSAAEAGDKLSRKFPGEECLLEVAREASTVTLRLRISLE